MIKCSYCENQAVDSVVNEGDLRWYCRDHVKEDFMNIKLDKINPPHYKSHPSGVECIQITEHMNFNLGNAMKYIWRCNEKGNMREDLEKAKWYIERELKRIEVKV